MLYVQYGNPSGLQVYGYGAATDYKLYGPRIRRSDLTGRRTRSLFPTDHKNGDPAQCAIGAHQIDCCISYCCRSSIIPKGTHWRRRQISVRGLEPKPMLMSFDSAFFRACLKALNIDNLSRVYHLGDAIQQRGLCIPYLGGITDMKTMARIHKICTIQAKPKYMRCTDDRGLCIFATARAVVRFAGGRGRRDAVGGVPVSPCDSV